MADTVKPSTITVTVNDDGIESESIDFHADLTAFNQYVNEIGAMDKIKPSFNYLMRTVVDEHRETLKKYILVGATPNGMAVMNIVGILSEEMGGKVSFAVKKPNR